MKHLSPAEFVDYVDGALPPDRARHVETCEHCAAQAGSLRDGLFAARVDAPEPSPLFWDHFPSRVRRAIESDPPATPGWRRPIAVLAWSVAVIALSVIALRAPNRMMPPSSSGPVVSEAGQQPADARADQDDDAFGVLTEAAADLQLEDARAVGLSVPVSTIDKAVLDLTPSEREELGRLLQDERKRAGI